METSRDSMKTVQNIKMEQDDFIITSNEHNRRGMTTPDPMEFRPELSSPSMSGHEIPLPNIFASPVKNAPIPPAVESPLTPRTKISINEEYPLPSVNSPIKQEPLLSEIPCSPGSPTPSSTFSMPSLTPSPAKKTIAGLRLKAHMATDLQKKLEQKPLITCICGYEVNDGFIVQCCKCRIWQHVDCFYTNASTRPVAHRCHLCVPRYVDYDNAKRIQRSKMLARSRLSSLVFDSNLGVEDSKNQIVPPNNAAPVPARSSKRKQSLQARSTPDARLTHTPDMIDMTEFEATGCRQKRYKTAEKNRYTEDLYKHLLRVHGGSPEHLKRNLALELSTKDCETVVTPQREIILVSTTVLSLYDTVIEYRGELMLKEEFLEKHDPTTEQNPYVLFYSGLNTTIVVDATKYGNEARYIRRSCKPNCEIKHTFGDNKRLHLIIWATQKVIAGKELTIPFDFDYKECKYDVTCPCNRKNCDVKRWNQAVAFKARSKNFLTNMDPELKKELEDLIPMKRAKQASKSEKTQSVKIEDDPSVKNEVKDSKNGSDSLFNTFSKMKGYNSSVKPKDEPSASKNLASISSKKPSSLLPSSITRLKSDAESRASLTARLQERLSPSKSGVNRKTLKPQSPVRMLHSPSKLSNGEHRPSSPSVHMSPSKQLQLQQQQSNRRNRRKQQFVALLNPFTENGSSSDEDPEVMPLWGLDGSRKPR